MHDPHWSDFVVWADDGTIRLWCTATGACNEVVEKAHAGSVLKLSVVRSFIWSSGSDGFIREWTIGGSERQCVRQIAPEGFDKGAYAIVPLGYEVWTCGHHPKYRCSHSPTFKTPEHPAHEPYVFNLLTVDRIETKIVWSTSIGDKKLKVGRHTIRGEVPSIDELKAANRLFEGRRMDEFVKRASKLEDELAVSAEEYRAQLEALATDLAKSKAEGEELAAKCKHLEDLSCFALVMHGVLVASNTLCPLGLNRAQEELEGKLMEDPEALAKFLQRALSFEKIFKDLGLEHFLDNPQALRQVLEAFADLGLENLLKNPKELKNFLSSAKQLKEMLEAAGFGDVFGDPSKLEELKQSLDLLRRVRDLFEKFGLGDAFKDPALLEEILSRYEGLRKAFEEYGFSELFEDPYNLKGFLRNYAKLREAFKDLGLEYLLDSAAAMRDFLAGHTSGEKELLDLRAKASRLDEAEEKLRRREEELASRLDPYLATDEGGIGAPVSSASEGFPGTVDSELAELRRLLEEKERERQEALERERMMAIKYKELDIFKLDIIARELKSLDNELGLVGKEAKFLQQSAGRLKDFGDQQQIHQHGSKMPTTELDQCVQLRSHIRDVIQKCLSETQKLHIGAAIDDPLAAGELKDGGVMAGFVYEEVEAS
ncbi:FBA1 [Symbiodinium natans]|uniref:FBA1 protein n=1 Tax=Symbiodinium natans TaxID=878477 RepID=A0A812MU07_9DINO|nr:FBA1 [Symbiodinium natans]